MPFNPALIEPAVRRYRRERDRYVKLADRIAEICKTDICEANAIRAQVTFRVKSPNSFEGKLRRFSGRPNKNYTDLEAIFDGVGDLAGVRIATYREEDRLIVKAAVERAFCGRNGGPIEVEDKNRQDQDPENFYRAIHIQAYLPEDERVGMYDNVADIGCEIQICTMMAHVWNEIEHDIGYKPDGDPGLPEKYHLLRLGNLVRQGDVAISNLLAEVAQRLAVQQGPFADVQDFVGRMSGSFPGIDFSQNVGQLFEVLQTLELNTPDAAKNAIVDPAGMDVALGELESFNAFLTEREESPRMERESSDVALIVLLRQRYREVLDSFRGQVGQGRGRPKRLYSLAVRYKKWREHEAAIS